jgi:hypothetical protein
MEWLQVLWQDNEESSSLRKTEELTMVAKDDVAWSLFGGDESDSDVDSDDDSGVDSDD